MENLNTKLLETGLLVCVFILTEFLDLFKFDDLILITKKKKIMKEVKNNKNKGNEMSKKPTSTNIELIYEFFFIYFFIKIIFNKIRRN